MNADLELVPGRSVGEVEPPAVFPELPAISDEEINAATKELGLTGFQASRIKALRNLGQTVRSSGVTSVGRGIVLFTTGQLMDLAESAAEEQNLAAGEDASGDRRKLMILRKDVAHELVGAAKILLESDQAAHVDEPPKTMRLPRFGEAVKPPVVVQNNLSVHLSPNER